MFDIKKGVYGENPIDEATLPAATTSDSVTTFGTLSATRAVAVGGVVGRLCFRIVAGEGGYTLKSGKKLSYTIDECDTVDGTFTSSVRSGNGHAASADTEYAEGEVIDTVEYSRDDKVFAKFNLSTDNTSAGKVKVVLDY